MKSLLILLVLVNCMYISKAQPGTLDKNFGSDGKVLEKTFNGDCQAIAIQQDGKIITGGYSGNIDVTQAGFLISRFNSDGSLDTNFGTNGKVIISKAEGATGAGVVALCIQTNGKILACGRFVTTSPYGDIGIVRYNTNGSIDSTFSENGVVITSVGNNDIVKDMCLQSDGKILVTGMKKNNENDNETSFIIRYLPDGTIDKSFGNNGFVITVYGAPIDIKCISLDSDQKIIVGGNYHVLQNNYTIRRYLPNGTIDNTFSEDGLATITLEEEDQPYSTLSDLKVEADGRIIITGTAGLNNFLLSIASLNSDGTPNEVFGNKKGYSVLSMTEGYSKGQTINISPDHKIVVTGIYYTGINTGFAAVRFKEDGFIDSTFGVNGVAVTGFDDEDIDVYTGSFLKNGNIIVGGNVAPRRGALVSNTALVSFINSPEKNKYLRIKHWLHHHGITWEDKPNNLINYYSIQSSTNGNAFTEVARIFSNHHCGIQTYKAASNATANYRVAAVSNTGNIIYSNTLTLSATPTIQLYPNPAKSILQIQGLPAGTTKLTVTDISGNTSIIATTNSTVYSINIAQLTSGNYMLHIKTANEVITKQFIKE